MRRAVAIGALIALGAGSCWWYWGRASDDTPFEIYGNVDLRQVDLAFHNSQRIAKISVHEGDRVARGQVVAELDTGRLMPQAAQAEAEVAALRSVVARLHDGSRPEEIAQARAHVRAAQAEAAKSAAQYQRLKLLSEHSNGGAVSRQDIDNAKAAEEVAEAHVQVSQQTLELAILGPRQEEIAEAEARLRASEAQLEYLQQELADAQLIAPVDAVVRTRIMEPGEIASPQRPVLQLAITDPKWVRAYVSEQDLGKLQHGSPTTISVDSFPDRRFDGWVGFVSPVAEFTPKVVQTPELRTSLVYEVRVFVKDPRNELRLGMPATVRLALQAVDESPADTKGQPREEVESQVLTGDRN